MSAAPHAGHHGHGDGRTAPPSAPSGKRATVYVRPMHPQFRRLEPGACPFCGMALEPEIATADTASGDELRAMTRRFWIGLALSVPVVALEMGGHLTGLHQWLGQRSGNWLQLVLATPVVLWAGWPSFERAARSLVTRNLNMFTLIALGAGVAWVYGVVATLAPEIFPTAFRGGDGAMAVYFEAAAVITVLVLLDLAPTTARRLRGDADGAPDEEIPLDALQAGERLRVRPGDKVPADGEVIVGRSHVDESMVGGESMPVVKQPGDRALGGTLNRQGSFAMRAERVGADTLLSRIVEMVAKAQRSRAPIQRLVDGVSAWFVPAVIVTAALAFVAWSIWGPAPRMTYGLIAAVAVLIIACPCALGLTTPMSIMVGIGRGAQAGVLIKDAEYPGRGRGALPGVRHPAVADHRGGGDGAVVGQRHRQRRATATHRADVT